MSGLLSLEEMLVNAGTHVDNMHDCLAGVTVTGHHQIGAAALQRLSLSHYESFLLLLREKRIASAMALIRPCTDAAQRSLYIGLNESAELIEKVLKDDKDAFGQQKHMVDWLHKRLGYDIFEDIHSSWPYLCSYTHGGLLQIERQLNGELFGENFTEEECIAAIASCTFPLSYCTFMFACLWRQETVTAGRMLADYYNLLPIPHPVRLAAMGLKK